VSERRAPFRHTGFPLILAAPSGAGKTSIARELATRRSDLEFSTSCTTRSARSGEQDGVDYHFRSDAEFRAMIAAGELLEWAEVHGHLYGTPLSNLVEASARRHLLLLDIDVQGSRQIKRSVPDAVSIFILPPNAEELARRLRGRASEDAGVRRRRLIAARDELLAATEFDFVVINDDLDTAVAAVERIIFAESHRTSRIVDLEQHVVALVDGIDATLDSQSN
jgi:guanylate kinase